MPIIRCGPPQGLAGWLTRSPRPWFPAPPFPPPTLWEKLARSLLARAPSTGQLLRWWPSAGCAWWETRWMELSLLSRGRGGVGVQQQCRLAPWSTQQLGVGFPRVAPWLCHLLSVLIGQWGPALNRPSGCEEGLEIIGLTPSAQCLVGPHTHVFTVLSPRTPAAQVDTSQRGRAAACRDPSSSGSPLLRKDVCYFSCCS